MQQAAWPEGKRGVDHPWPHATRYHVCAQAKDAQELKDIKTYHKHAPFFV